MQENDSRTPSSTSSSVEQSALPREHPSDDTTTTVAASSSAPAPADAAASPTEAELTPPAGPSNALHEGRHSCTHDGEASAHATGDASGSDAGTECWICRSSTSTTHNPIVEGVCRCRGSIGCVHQVCINQWVLKERRATCTSCGVTYRVVIEDDGGTVEYPKRIVDEVRLVLCFLVGPLLWSALVVGVGLLVKYAVIPCIVGAGFYYTEPSDLRSWLWWARTMLFGQLSCLALRSTVSGWDQWKDFFAEEGGRVEGGEVAETGNEPADGADTVLPPAAPRQEEQQQHQDEGTQPDDWSTTSDSSGGHGEDPEEEEEEEDSMEGLDDDNDDDLDAARFTWVEYAFWILRQARVMYGLDWGLPWYSAKELAACLPLSVVLRTRTGTSCVLTLCALICLVWRKAFPPKKIKDPRRRYDEVMERQKDATELDIKLWYGTYVVEILFFTFCLPVAAGITAHYAVSPYLVSAPASVGDFIASFSVFKLVFYWLLGTTFSVILMNVETNLMKPLFAPGVDLFFIRSVDLDFVEDMYWRFIITQVFDADPLRVILDYVRTTFFEAAALFFFLRLPVWALFGLREKLFQDTSAGHLQFPLPFGFPVSIEPSLLDNASFGDWLLLQKSTVEECVETFHYPFPSTDIPAVTSWGTFKSEYLGANHFCLGLYGLAMQHLQKAAALAFDALSDLADGNTANGTALANVTSPHVQSAVGCSSLNLFLAGVQVPSLAPAFTFTAEFRLHHSASAAVVINLVLAIMVFTVIGCFVSYPIQRYQLTLMRPLAVWMAGLFHLEEFLFDAERLQYVDNYLSEPEQQLLVMPSLPPAMIFMRRERAMEPDKVPKRLRWRVLGYGVLFFFVSNLLLWTVPVLLMVVAMSFSACVLPLLAVSLTVLFFVLNPRLYCEEGLPFGRDVVIALTVLPMVEVFVLAAALTSFSWTQLVRETFEYHYRLHRTVGLYIEPEEEEEEGGE